MRKVLALCLSVFMVLTTASVVFSASETTVVQAEDFISDSGIRNGSAWSPTCAGSNPCYMTFLNNASVSYSVSIPQDGAYEIRFYAGLTDTTNQDSLVTVTEDGTYLTAGEVVQNGNYNQFDANVIGTVNLTEGTHKLVFAMDANQRAFEMDYISFTYVAEYGSAVVIPIEAEWGTYQSAGSATRGAVLKTNARGSYCERLWGYAGDSLTYSVDIPFDGKYTVNFYGDGIDPNTPSEIAVKVDGTDCFSTEITGLADYYVFNQHSLGELNLTAGTHSITLFTKQKACYFDYFTLERTGNYCITVQAEDKTGIKNGTVNSVTDGLQLLLGASCYYTVTVPLGGLYKLTAYAYPYKGEGADSVLQLMNEDELLSSVTVPGQTGASAFAAYQSGDTFALEADTYTLSFGAQAGGYGCYVDCFVMEYVGAYSYSHTWEAESARTASYHAALVNGGTCITWNGTATGGVDNGDSMSAYSVSAPRSGLYQISAKAMTMDTKAPVVYISVDGIAQTFGTVETCAEYKTNKLGIVNLTAGMHTITFSTVRDHGWAYIDSFTIEYMGTAPSVLQAVSADSAAYTVTAEKAGYYAVNAVISANASDGTYQITANDVTTSKQVAAFAPVYTGENTQTIPAGIISLGWVYLNEGENQLQLVLPSGVTVSQLSLSQPQVTLSSDGKELSEAQEGNLTGKIQCNGLYDNVSLAIAVYDGEKLQYIDRIIQEKADYETLTIDATAEHPTQDLRVKIFVWDADSLRGNCYSF